MTEILYLEGNAGILERIINTNTVSRLNLTEFVTRKPITENTSLSVSSNL